jgi:hypothetical protein
VSQRGELWTRPGAEGDPVWAPRLRLPSAKIGESKSRVLLGASSGSKVLPPAYGSWLWVPMAQSSSDSEALDQTISAEPLR